VETAVVLPLVILLVLGAIDVGRAISVQQTLVDAARAGCRLYAAKEELAEEDAQAMIGRTMAEANLEGYTIQFDPDPSEKLEHLSPVTVSVAISYDRVAWVSSWFLSERTLVGTCIMPADTAGHDD